ncbi:MAG TPA: hypothetical protein VLK78_05780 [Candidatus Angelobacter sp.]|nr:hypothetical protein [Candidatus Angelobacter sp.]
MLFKVMFTLVNGDMEIFTFQKNPRQVIKQILSEKDRTYILQGNKLILIDKIVKIEFMDLRQPHQKEDEVVEVLPLIEEPLSTSKKEDLLN